MPPTDLWQYQFSAVCSDDSSVVLTGCADPHGSLLLGHGVGVSLSPWGFEKLALHSTDHHAFGVWKNSQL